jgi:hypothetical protein
MRRRDFIKGLPALVHLVGRLSSGQQLASPVIGFLIPERPKGRARRVDFDKAERD